MPFPSLEEIRERKIVQWALAYLTGAWLALQVLNIVGERFGWPDIWLRMLIIALGVGFFGVLVVSWYHGEKGAQRVSGTELLILTVLLFVGGIAMVIAADDGVVPVGMDGPEPSSAIMTPSRPARSSPSQPSIEATSIAVLPFENVSADTTQRYFVDGLTDEILTALARVKTLRVAGRTSSFRFKKTDASLDSIRRALRVAHIVEGSVRKAGNRVRISARMVNAETGFREWGDSYDRSLTDVFAVQDEIGRAVAQALRVHVTSASLAQQGTEDPEAYALVLKGRQAFQQRSGAAETWLPEIERTFEEARERDSTYAAAWAGLARVHQTAAYLRLLEDVAATWEQARAEARQALILDENEEMAHYVLALIAQSRDQNDEEAARHFEQVLEANPSNAQALAAYGLVLLKMGERDEALQKVERAVTLDPLSASARNSAAGVYYYAGEMARAEEQIRSALALVPGNPTLQANIAIVLAEQGKATEAVAAAKQAVAIDPDLNFARTALAYAQAKAGRRQAAKRDLAQLPEDNYYHRAMVHAALGDRDVTFRLLDRAVAEKDPFATDLALDPTFDYLRGDPRMDRLIQRLNTKRTRSAP